jgi:hypothetical protein
VPDPSPDPYLDFVPSSARSGTQSLLYTRNTQTSTVLAPHPSERAHVVYANLSLVSRVWYAETRPYLWSIVKVGMPASFEKILSIIGTSDDGVEEITRATRRELCLSPPASRDASPVDRSRGRRAEVNPSLSSVVWARSASVESRRDLLKRGDSPGSIGSMSILHPEPFDERNPGLLISYLSFSRFRTHGMRRSVREGSQHRFVTPARMLRMLRGTRAPGSLVEGEGVEFQEEWDIRGRLAAVGLTEYMDSALTREVLEELLLRGPMDVRYRSVDHPDKTVLHKEGTPAALAARPIVALDFCGCVSARFVEGLTELVEDHKLGLSASKLPSDEDPCTLKGFDGKWTKERAFFPHLRRLGLSHTLLAPDLLTDFVASFPNLTHLDLSLSRASPSLLQCLAEAQGMRLESLSLARCQSLTSESIKKLLVESDVTATLKDLSLYGNSSVPSPLTADDLREVLRDAACFQRGGLRVLDLSSVAVTDSMLEHDFPALPELVELGLANCRQISFEGVAAFLESKAPNVQVLDLTASCSVPIPTQPASATFRSRGGGGGGGGSESLMSIVDLHTYLIARVATTDPAKFASRRTHLRVIELDERSLEAIQAGAGDWKVQTIFVIISFYRYLTTSNKI